MIEDLKETISQLEDLKEKTEAAETKEEIQEIAKEVREIWKKCKWGAQRHVARLLLGRFENAIEKLESAEARVMNWVEEHDDSAAVEELLEELSGEIDEAAEKVRKLKNFLRKHTNLETMIQMLKK